MTIRYECEQCGSTLKIKDDLAGKPGKCPKCKTAFTVPATDEERTNSDSLSDSQPELPASKAVTKKTTGSKDDDFDVDAFLMSDAGPKSKSQPKTVASSFNEDDFLSDEPASKQPSKGSISTSLESEDDDKDFQIRPAGRDSKLSKRHRGVDDEPSAPASPSRRPPGTTSSGTAATIASDLLAKTGKKGRKTAWNEVEAESKETEYDYTDLKNYLFKKVVPMVVGGVVGVYLLFLMASAMMGGKSSLPGLGQVTGTVTLGGKPLPNAMVWFHPIQSVEDRADKKKRVSSSAGVTNESGRYELGYIESTKGAVIGECRIQIEAPSRSDIPAKWVGGKSTETRKVESGRKVIDLDLSK